MAHTLPVQPARADPNTRLNDFHRQVTSQSSSNYSKRISRTALVVPCNPKLAPFTVNVEGYKIRDSALNTTYYVLDTGPYFAGPHHSWRFELPSNDQVDNDPSFYATIAIDNDMPTNDRIFGAAKGDVLVVQVDNDDANWAVAHFDMTMLHHVLNRLKEDGIYARGGGFGVPCSTCDRDSSSILVVYNIV